MLSVVRRQVDNPKLPASEPKTRCPRCPGEPIKFLGYRIGRDGRTDWCRVGMALLGALFPESRSPVPRTAVPKLPLGRSGKRAGVRRVVTHACA